MEPRYFVGIGGTGVSIATLLHRKIRGLYGADSEAAKSLFPVFGLDGENWKNQMDNQFAYVATGSFNPGVFVKHSEIDWFPVEADKCHMRLGTTGLGGIRAFGHAALLHHVVQRNLLAPGPIHEAVFTTHRRAMEVNSRAVANSRAQIVVAGSACGATGAGMMIAVAHALRSHFRSNDVDDVDIIAYVLLPGTQTGKGNGTEALHRANAYAFTWETDFWSDPAKHEGRAYDYGACSANIVKAVGSMRPFDMVFLIDGESDAGRYLNSYGEYEQLAADLIFDQCYLGPNPAIVNILTNVQQGITKAFGTGSKAILRFPIRKQAGAFAARVIARLIAEEIHPTAANEAEGEDLVNGIWPHLFGQVTDQRYDAATLIHGRDSSLVDADTQATEFGIKAKGVDGDTYEAFIVDLDNRWRTYQRELAQHFEYTQPAEIKKDWDWIAGSLRKAIADNDTAPSSLGALTYALPKLSKALRELKVKKEEARDAALDREKALLEKELPDAKEKLRQAYRTVMGLASRGSAAERMGRTAGQLIQSHWRRREMAAEVDHLEQLAVMLDEGFKRAVTEVGAALQENPVGAPEADDVYTKCQVVTEVLGDRAYADERFDAKLKDDPHAWAAFTASIRPQARRAIGKVLLTKALPATTARETITEPMRRGWASEIHDGLFAETIGEARKVFPRSVWEAMRIEAERDGTKVALHVKSMVANARLKAALWIKTEVLDKAVVKKPAVLGHQEQMSYSRDAWRAFATGTLGERKPSSLEAWLGAGAGEASAVPSDRAFDEDNPDEVPGNPFEVSFFRYVMGYDPTQLTVFDEWRKDAEQEILCGRAIFVDKRYTAAATSQTRRRNRRLLFLLAEHLGVLVFSAKDALTFRRRVVKGAPGGRAACAAWFADSPDISDHRRDVREAVERKIKAKKPAQRAKELAKLYANALKELEQRRDDTKNVTGAESEFFKTDAKLVKAAIEEEIYAMGSLDV